MRKQIIAGNWKMNLSIKDSIKLAKGLKSKIKSTKNKEIIISPSFTALNEIHKIIKNSKIKLAAQNVCYENNGAFTGEVSASMLKGVGCSYTIIGHSEQRHVFNETDDIINLKVLNSIKNKLKVILCIGETLKQKNKNQTNDVIINQLKKGLSNIKNSDMKNIIIAYEPVWAISGGDSKKTPAKSSDAENAHELIRKVIKSMYNQKISNSIQIIYGGSVKPDNIAEIMMQSDIDGVLVGGASLDSKKFIEITKY
jgi:triosephosphate isomerase (TIM)